MFHAPVVVAQQAMAIMTVEWPPFYRVLAVCLALCWMLGAIPGGAR
jgi:hypothetical protein